MEVKKQGRIKVMKIMKIMKIKKTIKKEGEDDQKKANRLKQQIC